MPEQATDLVRQFVGYLHLDELQNKSIVDFDAGLFTESKEILIIGARLSGPSVDYEYNDIDEVAPINVSFPATEYFFTNTIEYAEPLTTRFADASDQFNKHTDFSPASPLSKVNIQSLKSVLSAESSITENDVQISLIYNYRETHEEIADVSQENILTDNDVRAEGSGPPPESDFDIDQLIDDMIKVAGNEIPQSAFDNIHNTSVETVEHVSEVSGTSDANDTDTLRSEELFAAAQTNVETDTIFEFQDNDEFGGNNADVLPADSSDANNGIDELEPIPADGGIDQVAISLAKETDVEEEIDASQPQQESVQTLSTGDNLVQNGAAVIDTDDGYGGIIIGGDYHETNAIFQVNIIADNDQVILSGEGDISSHSNGENLQFNDASFERDSLSVSGEGNYGLFPGATWVVDYIDGDFYNITSIYQNNLLNDNDVAEVSLTQSYYTTSQGGNTLVNVTNVNDFASANYDLIIVDGDYYEFNGIYQTNILLDNDLIKVMSGGSQSGKHESDAGSNEQINIAQIVNLGDGSNYQDLSDNVKDFADEIEDGETEFDLDFDFVSSLPGNGTDLFNVLFVSGDYFEYKLIEQWNVVADVDYADFCASENSTDIDDVDDFDQLVETGGNELINAAIIIDVESTSDFQFLGGDYYEDTMLVQANIIEDENEIVVSESAQDPISLVTGNNNDNSGPGSSGGDNSGHGNSGSDDDVLPGMYS